MGSGPDRPSVTLYLEGFANDFIAANFPRLHKKGDKAGQPVGQLDRLRVPDFVVPVPNPTLHGGASSVEQFAAAGSTIIFWAPHLLWAAHVGRPRCVKCRRQCGFDGWRTHLHPVSGDDATHYIKHYGFCCKKCPGEWPARGQRGRRAGARGGALVPAAGAQAAGGACQPVPHPPNTNTAAAAENGGKDVNFSTLHVDYMAQVRLEMQPFRGQASLWAGQPSFALPSAQKRSPRDHSAHACTGCCLPCSCPSSSANSFRRT